jgi:alkylation response protein AidB-like acyl-CoA dehydrogenase
MSESVPIDALLPQEIARRAEEVGARNEVAKVLVARARCHRAAGNVAAARTALEQALAVFTSLGTVDGPLLVASLLQSLPNRIDTERAQPAS